MLVSLREILEQADKGGYAVGAFNVPNLESLQAILGASQEMGRAVIVDFAPLHEALIPLDVIAPIMLREAEKASVPVCVHLDHGASMEICVRAIRLGFTSVMYDGSAGSYEENLENTASVVRMAHSVGVSVEAELGHIFVSDNGVSEKPAQAETADSFESLEDVYTDPQKAKEFASQTGVDALAVAFGTAHGIYTKKPVLDMDRITRIREKTSVPLVMHGGSGLSEEEFRTAVRNGIRKINYYTYMTLAGGSAVKEVLSKMGAKENIFYHDIPLIAQKAMKENVKEAIRIFSLD